MRTLLFPPHIGIDLIAAFYGCLYAGCVPITVRPPHPQNIATTLPTVKMIVEVTLPAGAGPSSSWGGGRGRPPPVVLEAGFQPVYEPAPGTESRSFASN